MITEYSFGRIKVNGREYTHDLIVSGDKVTDWWREEGHNAQAVDFGAVPDDVEFLVIGTGASGMMDVAGDVEASFRKKGIKVIALPTQKAVEEFDSLTKQKKKCAGAFHLTC